MRRQSAIVLVVDLVVVTVLITAAATRLGDKAKSAGGSESLDAAHGDQDRAPALDAVRAVKVPD
jgi:hypothetical protein